MNHKETEPERHTEPRVRRCRGAAGRRLAAHTEEMQPWWLSSHPKDGSCVGTRPVLTALIFIPGIAALTPNPHSVTRFALRGYHSPSEPRADHRAGTNLETEDLLRGVQASFSPGPPPELPGCLPVCSSSGFRLPSWGGGTQLQLGRRLHVALPQRFCSLRPPPALSCFAWTDPAGVFFSDSGLDSTLTLGISRL